MRAAIRPLVMSICGAEFSNALTGELMAGIGWAGWAAAGKAIQPTAKAAFRNCTLIVLAG